MDKNFLLLAARHHADLTSAEIALLDAVQNGLEALPPSHLQVEIRAELLGWICSDQLAKPAVHRHGILMTGFKVTGNLDLIHAEVLFPMEFRRCEFMNQIWLKGARLRALAFRGCKLHGIHADGTEIDTNLLMIEGFKCFGEVAFRAARIGGDLRTDSATFSSKESTALVCDRINVTGGVFLSRNSSETTFMGEVRFAGAKIGGNFDCEGAVFSNPLGAALSAERLVVAGGVFLRGSHGYGEMSLSAAKIGVVLDCRGASFTGPTERTLNAERATIGAYALLDGEFSCDYVHFLATIIEGGLRCRLATIRKLDLRHARIEGPFEWADMTEPSKSSIDFRDARLESIKDDEDSWPKAGAVQFDGLRFERFSDSLTDVPLRLRWLKLDASDPAQPYKQLSIVYERSGRSDFARQVLFEFERLTRSRYPGAAAKVWNFLLRWTIGYGYKLWRAVVIVLVLTAIGWGLALVGYRAKLIAPSDKEANAIFIATGGTPANYPRFSAGMFSIEHSLPGVNLGLSSYWSADTAAVWPNHRRVGEFIRFWFWIQMLLGWLLSIFFVAGLSGVIKSAK